MERISPTRRQLLALRARHSVIRKGLELLKSKREALMKEFFKVVDESIEKRDTFSAMLNKAQFDIEKAAAMGGASLDSFAMAVKRDVTIRITLRNVWGVNIPETGDVELVRGPEAFNASLLGERADIVAAAREFEVIAGLILKIASVEARLARLGEAIKADTRKINAISEVMLPSIKKNIKSIERALEERERESVYRLKRYKGKRP